MSPLPRLTQPRGPSARIAAMVARAPAQAQLELPLSPPSRLDAIAAAAGPRAHVWASPDAPPVVILPPPCHDCGGPCAPERSRCEECLRTAAAKTAARRGGPRPRARRVGEVAPAVAVKAKAPRAPKAPKAKGRKPAPPRLVWEGPVLLQERASGTGTAEQRERGCPRMGQCEDDWILAGREGQARCPAGCGVWGARGGGVE